MGYKIGDIIECVAGFEDRLTKGKFYEIIDIDRNSELSCIMVKCDRGFNSWFSDRFRSDREDTPTLSDFDKLRLQTAAMIHSTGVWTTNGAMEKADELIKLVLATPFKLVSS